MAILQEICKRGTQLNLSPAVVYGLWPHSGERDFGFLCRPWWPFWRFLRPASLRPRLFLVGIYSFSAQLGSVNLGGNPCSIDHQASITMTCLRSLTESQGPNDTATLKGQHHWAPYLDQGTRSVAVARRVDWWRARLKVYSLGKKGDYNSDSENFKFKVHSSSQAWKF